LQVSNHFLNLFTLYKDNSLLFTAEHIGEDREETRAAGLEQKGGLFFT